MRTLESSSQWESTGIIVFFSPSFPPISLRLCSFTVIKDTHIHIQQCYGLTHMEEPRKNHHDKNHSTDSSNYLPEQSGGGGSCKNPLLAEKSAQTCKLLRSEYYLLGSSFNYQAKKEKRFPTLSTCLEVQRRISRDQPTNLTISNSNIMKATEILLACSSFFLSLLN